MRPVTPRDSCHTVYMYGERLCVECKVCRHRVALASRLFHRGDMQEVQSLNLVCEHGESRNVALLLPHSAKEAEDWERGVEPTDD